MRRRQFSAMKPVNIIQSESPERIPLCGSRFWGDPDLPVGYPYPTYTDVDGDPCEYRFVCQINLCELASYDPENRLPHRGLLSFFAKIGHYLGDFDDPEMISGYVSDTDDVRVLFFPEAGMPGDNPGFERVVLVDGDGGRVNPSELGMRFSRAPVEGHVEEHALFAGPSHREWESWEHPYEDWEILLQVDSFDGEGFTLNFMDCGVLDFLISPQDLAARRFDRVRAIVLST